MLALEALSIQGWSWKIDSIRTGAATFLLYLVNGPSAVPVYLRAGWTLGNIPDRYIHDGARGDQLVERTIYLLPLLEADRYIPHFTQEGLNKISEFGWDKLYPGYNKLSETLEGFKSVLQVIVANIAFHFDWRKTNLSATGSFIRSLQRFLHVDKEVRCFWCLAQSFHGCDCNRNSWTCFRYIGFENRHKAVGGFVDITSILDYYSVVL